MIRSTQDRFNAEIEQEAGVDELQVYYVRVVQNTLNFLEENAALVRSVLQSSMYSVLLNIVADQVVIDVSTKLIENLAKGRTLPANPELIAHIFSGALISTAQWWLKQKGNVPRQKIVDQLIAMVQRI
jgi:hypothetical protein